MSVVPLHGAIGSTLKVLKGGAVERIRHTEGNHGQSHSGCVFQVIWFKSVELFPFGSAENNYFTEMCSGSEAGSCLRPIDFVYHSTLGLRVIQKKKARKRTSDWRVETSIAS